MAHTRLLLALSVATCLIAYASAQCAGSDNANCVNWVRNGFCNNGAYTLAQKQQFCPRSCPGICGGAPPAPVTQPPGPSNGDANRNCLSWSVLPHSPFCVDPTRSTFNFRALYCAATCKFEITPTADCAVYTVNSGVFTRASTSNRTPSPGVAVGFPSSSAIVPSYIFARSTCTVTLYEGSAIDVFPGTTSPGQTLSGAAGNFQKISNPRVTSYSCTCT